MQCSPRETIPVRLCGLPRPRGSFPRSRPMGDLAFHRVALCRTSRRRWPSRTTCPRSSRRLHHVVTRPKALKLTSRSTRRPRPERRQGARLRSVALLGLLSGTHAANAATLLWLQYCGTILSLTYTTRSHRLILQVSGISCCLPDSLVMVRNNVDAHGSDGMEDDEFDADDFF